ncbi:MAG: LysR family transcriptional regulator [Candidatus Contendobacter sp.]|nr:LysR family transcriptional regulator [Candidatus Contendobacter sp.]MDS4059125.1 LysR family transcriptional regulator [Candidatus Contendobacter sp.]
MTFPRTTLEQWQVLQAIVEQGGFAQAAAALHRSQSAISYAVARLREQLGVELLAPEGRRMVLTPVGEALLRDARPLLDAAFRLERRARALQQDWEPEVRLAVDGLCPTAPLLEALAAFAARCPATRLHLHEEVLSGAEEALIRGEVDLALVTRVPPGFLGDEVAEAEFVAVAAPDHPLHQRGPALTVADLEDCTQVVVRDSGLRQPRDEGWLGSARRWTVGSPDTAVALVGAGLAFGWLPRHRIENLLATGGLVPLSLACGARYRRTLYLVIADEAGAGPAARTLAAGLRESLGGGG